MIRVLLADDHGVIRDGLGRLIGGLDDVELVGTASDGAEAVERARRADARRRADGPRHAALDGIEATRRILADRPGTAVLVLTAFSDRPRILGALEAGACGYLLKDVASEEVAEGIRAAARGESPLDPRAARTVLSARSEPDPLAGLSEREREVLDAARRGPAEQADRAPAGDQREDRQVPPHADLPRARRHRPHAGRAVGRAPRTRPKVALSSGPGRCDRAGHDRPSCAAAAAGAARRRAAATPRAVTCGDARAPAPTAREIEATFVVDRGRPLADRVRPRGPRRAGAATQHGAFTRHAGDARTTAARTT